MTPADDGLMGAWSGLAAAYDRLAEALADASRPTDEVQALAAALPPLPQPPPADLPPGLAARLAGAAREAAAALARAQQAAEHRGAAARDAAARLQQARRALGQTQSGPARYLDRKG